MSSAMIQLEQAQRLMHEGKHAQARAVVQRVLQRTPADPAANQVMAVVLAGEKKFEQAVYYIDRAIAARPEVAQFLLMKATFLSNTPRVMEAIPVLRAALAIAPGHVDMWCVLGVLEWRNHEASRAEKSFRRALELRPNHPEAAAPLAGLLLDTGHPEAAVDLLRAAGAAHPADIRLAETLAFCLNYDHRAAAAEVFEAHRRFGRLTEGEADRRLGGVKPLERAGPGTEGRRIRIGYVSPDLREHAVATFIGPVLEAHDRSRFEVFAYHTSPVADAITQGLRGRVDHWFGSRVLGDAELLERLRADRLDILVELSGLSSQNRLAVVACRPAAVQATFIGYPCTTGLTRIDHQIVDTLTDPPGADAFSTERLARLPHCLLCYSPPPDCPEVGVRLGEGGITFGSFNTVGKTTGFTLSLWARVLEAVPGSRLLLKATGLTDPATHAAFVERAKVAGVPVDRLDLMGHTPRRDHMAAYGRVDVCLDPFPFSGATTTCDALWMGVPVVTLRGDRHVSRASASILTAIGRQDWVAGSQDEYVKIAAGLAADAELRGRERGTLRERMRGSPLCDAAGYTRALEALFTSWVGPAPATAG